MNLRVLFDDYCRIEEQEERLQFACRNPALVSSKLLPGLEVEINGDQSAAAQPRMERLAELDAFRVFLARSASRYPAGVGPIEREAQRVAAGETSLDAALAQMRKPALTFQLAPIYVHVLTWHAEQMVTNTDPATAVLWTRMLAEACLADCPADEVNEPLEIAGIGFIQVAGVALGSIPDGEILESADAMGRKLLNRLRAEADLPRRAAVLHALGSLYSDPISASTGSGASEVEHREHLRRLEAKKGPALARWYQEQHRLPPPEKALAKAIKYFERALPGRTGASRGITLKAIAQTLIFLAECEGKSVDKERVRQLCAEAIPLLESNDYQRRATLGILQAIGLPAEAEQPAAPKDKAKGTPISSEPKSPDEALQLADEFRLADPVRALQVLAGAQQLFEAIATESQRRNRLISMLRLIPDAYGAPSRDEFPGPVEKAAQAALQTAQSQNWSADRLGAAMLRLAIRSGTTNEEEAGLRLLQLVNEHAPAIAAYQAPIAFLYADMSIGAAVNAVNAGEFIAAVQHYGRALAPSLRLRQPSRVFELLERMADIALNPAPEMDSTVLLALAPIAFEIERELGLSGAEAMQAVYQNVFASMSDTLDSAVVAMLLQLGKGARFSAMLRQGPGFDWRTDAKAMELHRRIELLRAQIDEPLEFEPMEELLLVSAIGSQEVVASSTAADELKNLERTFDRYLTSLMIQDIRSSAIIRPEIIQQLLGDRTVLVDCYLAAHNANQRAIHLVLYTTSEIVAFKNLVPAGEKDLVARSARAEALLDPIGWRTSRVRQALQLDPGEDWLHPEARDALAADFELLLGTPTWNHLETLRQAGKDHLCIRPHGALRYYPMHLLGPSGQNLAQYWTVTSIPSLECLLPRETPPRTIPMQALGLTYRGGKPFHLPELAGAELEIKAVADAWGVKPMLDSEATETQVLAALQSARRVHLCAHGLHNAGSPLFQQIFVTPDAESDGRLCAYKILGHDLRGVEILSLGACDSALGRFDAGDNLSGLPAALLAAGTSSIVASLWEISDQTAQMFFRIFHEELARGVPRLDAFRKAQCEVRTAFPQARDWAAFSFIGDWQNRDASVIGGLNPYIRLSV